MSLLHGDDLSLGFNAGAASLAAGLWGRKAVGAAGDVRILVAAPAGSFHHHRAAADPVFPIITAAQRTLVDADAASGKPLVSSAAGAIQIQFWYPEAAGGGIRQPRTAPPARRPLPCWTKATAGTAPGPARRRYNSHGFDCKLGTAAQRGSSSLGAGGTAQEPPSRKPCAHNRKARNR